MLKRRRGEREEKKREPRGRTISGAFSGWYRCAGRKNVHIFFHGRRGNKI